MSERIPVLATVAAAWRYMLTRPLAVLKVGWLPVLVAVTLPMISITGFAGSVFLWKLAIGFGGFSIFIVAMIAWQRIVLYGADARKGSLPLRLGRAELLSILHFPLAGFLFVPLQTPAMAAWIAEAPAAGGSTTLLAWTGIGVLVFPGGLLLARGALMLPAFAAAGASRSGLGETANRVWALGEGNSFRLWFALGMAAAPFVAVLAGFGALGQGVETPYAGIALSVLQAVAITLYVLLIGGVYAECWRTLGGMDGRARSSGAKKKVPAAASSR